MSTLNEEHFELWMQDLETTEAKQGTGSLGNEEVGYCCLGRGCVVAGISYRSTDPYDGNFTEWLGLGRSGPNSLNNIKIVDPDLSMLTDKQLSRLEDAATMDYPNRFVTASQLNDTAGLTFKEIAKVMRANKHKLQVY